MRHFMAFDCNNDFSNGHDFTKMDSSIVQRKLDGHTDICDTITRQTVISHEVIFAKNV